MPHLTKLLSSHCHRMRSSIDFQGDNKTITLTTANSNNYQRSLAVKKEEEFDDQHQTCNKHYQQNHQQQQQQQQQPQQRQQHFFDRTTKHHNHLDKQQRATSSFSNAVEIYQNKLNRNLNSRNATNAPILEDYHSTASSRTVPALLADESRVNFLHAEIARLRQEMLVKIDVLEKDMYEQSTSDNNHVVRSTHKSTQTDTSNTSSLSLKENLHAHIDSNKSSSSLNDSLLTQLMTQIDQKLNTLKHEIFQKFEESVNAIRDNNYVNHHTNRESTAASSNKYASHQFSDVQLTASNRIDTSHECENNERSHIFDRRMNKNSHSTRNNEHKQEVLITTKTLTIPTATASENECSRDYSLRSDSDASHTFALYPARRETQLSAMPQSDNPMTGGTSTTPTTDNTTLHENNIVHYQIIDQYSQTAREELARHLVDQLFLYDDLADANVRGVKGKRLLDPAKIQKIRQTIFQTYPSRHDEDKDLLWKLICDKINAKCRGVTRTLKRKSTECSYRFNDYNLSASEIMDYQRFQNHDQNDYDAVSKGSYNSQEEETFMRKHDFSQSSSDSDSSSMEISRYASANSSSTTSMPINTHDYNPKDLVYDAVTKPHASLSLVVDSRGSNSDKTSIVETTNENDDIDVILTDDELTDEECDTKKTGVTIVKETVNRRGPNEIEAALDLCDRLAEKYTDHYPTVNGEGLDIVSERKRLQGNREEFTRTLIEALFTRSTLAHSNVTGARGKFMLEPLKIAKIRSTVFRKFPADNDDEEEVLWKILTTKINTKCRGVKRLMKRKGIPADNITRRYHTMNSRNSEGVGGSSKQNRVKDESTYYPAIYEEEIQSLKPYS